MRDRKQTSKKKTGSTKEYSTSSFSVTKMEDNRQLKTTIPSWTWPSSRCQRTSRRKAVLSQGPQSACKEEKKTAANRVRDAKHGDEILTGIRTRSLQ